MSHGLNPKTDSTNQISDANTIIIVNSIKRLNPKIILTCDITDLQTILWFSGNKQLVIEKDPLMSPQFAAGEIFYPHIYDSLLCQVIKNNLNV